MHQRRIVFVIFDRFQSLDLTGPLEVFSCAGRVSGGYRCQIVASCPGPVRAGSGLAVHAEYGVAGLDPSGIDTLVVTGGGGVDRARHDPALVGWIATAGAGVRRLTSVCSGVFLLAAAGLVTGRTVTTHWGRAEQLAHEHPELTVDCDPIFIRDGRVWTSAGVTAGMDLALALVSEDRGREVALRVARQLVMYVQRPGGQAQFSAQLGAQAPARDPLADLQAWIAEHPAEDHAVDRLAYRVAMSPRHFARVFRAEVGCTPATYVERTRVEVARRLLETTALSVEQVAAAAGFGTPETLRRAFGRRVGASPTEYRERFRPLVNA